MSILKGAGIFYFLRVMIGGGLFLVISYCIIARGVWDCYSAEKIYQQQYGETWREHYQAERHVTVEEDHKKILLGMGGMAAMTVLCYLIYRQIVPRRAGRRRSRRHRSSAAIQG